jgi:hypothetical protein
MQSLTLTLRRAAITYFALATTVAHADPEQARARYKAANEHYAAARFDLALVELEAAYAANPEPEYLFAIAQVHRVKQDCQKAIPAYGAYLRTGPAPEATKMAQKMIDQCVASGASVIPAQQTEAAQAQPQAQPATPAAPAEPLVIREVQRVHLRDVTLPWYRDVWGDVLAGSGLVGLIVGGVALARASSHDDKAATSTNYGAFDDELRARDRAQVIGGVALTAGGVLIVGGLLHYALRPKKVKTEVRIDPGTGEASVSIGWPSF